MKSVHSILKNINRGNGILIFRGARIVIATDVSPLLGVPLSPRMININLYLVLLNLPVNS